MSTATSEGQSTSAKWPNWSVPNYCVALLLWYVLALASCAQTCQSCSAGKCDGIHMKFTSMCVGCFEDGVACHIFVGLGMAYLIGSWMDAIVSCFV